MTSCCDQDEELIRLFGGGKGAGHVTAVRVVRNAKTNKGKGFAFVEFSEKAFARMALSVDGRLLRERQLRVTKVAKTGSAAATAAETRLRTPFSRGDTLCLIWQHRGFIKQVPGGRRGKTRYNTSFSGQ